MERIGAYDPNRPYQAPPMNPNMNPNMPPYMPMPPATRKKDKPKAEGEYDPKGRSFAIILSVCALAITIVALFAIPVDFEHFDKTILRVGMNNQTAIFAMTFVTLAVGIVALIEPLMTVVSGISLMATAALIFTANPALGLSTPGMIVFVLLAIDIIALGIVSMIFMKKFIANNIEGVPIFKACWFTWTGIAHQ